MGDMKEGGGCPELRVSEEASCLSANSKWKRRTKVLGQR